MPDTAERAVQIAEGGGVAWTEKIVLRSVAGEKFDRIVGYILAATPEPAPAGDTIPLSVSTGAGRWARR